VDAIAVLQAVDGAGATGPKLAPRVVVALRWRCGAPPPPVAGVSGGRLVLRLDAPVGRTFTVPATCDWGGADGQATQPMLVSTASRLSYGRDTFLRVAVQAADRVRRDVTVRLDVTDTGEGRRSDYDTEGSDTPAVQYWVDAAPGLGTGHVRFRALPMAEAGDPHEMRSLDGTDATASLSGTVRFACDPPVAPPDPVDRADDAGDPEVVPGTLALEFDLTLPGLRFDGPTTCELERMDDEVYATRIHGRLADGNGSLTIDLDQSVLRIARVDAAGVFIGEYEGRVLQYADIAEKPFAMFVPGVVLIGTDASFRPFDVGEGPVTATGVTVTYACEVPDEAP
jgi:hypothetical protein